MSFKRGEPRPANAGKKKGSRNKKSVVLDSFAQYICEGGAAKFKKELEKLEGKEYVSAYMSMFEYVKPKLQRTEHQGEVRNINYNVELTKKEIREIDKTLEDEC